MNQERKYQFFWELLGDIKLGRPNLGNSARLEVYRLMQFCFRDVMEQNLSTKETDRIFYESGKLAGIQFYNNVIGNITDLDVFVQKLQNTLEDIGIGLLRVEKADVKAGSFVLTISEDLDCSGLPELNYEICTYDEGFIAGLMESFTGEKFKVKEVDCWCTGARTCRFTADLVK